MHMWIYTAVLAALMLNIALALPVTLDDIVETGETDEQLLQLLSGHDMPDEAVSPEHQRLRRMPIEDPDKVGSGSGCGGHMHADELAHEHLGHKHAGRERRAAGKDSSGSSEEAGKGGQGQEHAQDKSNSSSEEEKPKVRRRRDADSSGSSMEVGAEQTEPEQQDKSDSSSEEKPSQARKRRSAGENLNISSAENAQTALEEKENISEQLDPEAIDSATYLTMEDYAQGCEVLEVNSNEVNNETTYVE